MSSMVDLSLREKAGKLARSMRSLEVSGRDGLADISRAHTYLEDFIAVKLVTQKYFDDFKFLGKWSSVAYFQGVVKEGAFGFESLRDRKIAIGLFKDQSTERKLGSLSGISTILREGYISPYVANLISIGSLDGERLVLHKTDPDALDSKVNVLFMELVDGKDLLSQMNSFKDKPLEIKELVATNLLKALMSLHERKISHGDVKPANILIGDDNVIKLIDYDNSSSFGEDILTFTSPYGSPELIKWYLDKENVEPIQASKSQDYWQYGVSLIQIMTGNLVFSQTPKIVKTLHDEYNELLGGCEDEFNMDNFLEFLKSKGIISEDKLREILGNPGLKEYKMFQFAMKCMHPDPLKREI